MIEPIRRHSWWVWVIVVVAIWTFLAFMAPKVNQWVPARPAIHSPR